MGKFSLLFMTKYWKINNSIRSHCLFYYYFLGSFPSCEEMLFTVHSKCSWYIVHRCIVHMYIGIIFKCIKNYIFELYFVHYSNTIPYSLIYLFIYLFIYLIILFIVRVNLYFVHYFPVNLYFVYDGKVNRDILDQFQVAQKQYCNCSIVAP